MQQIEQNKKWREKKFGHENFEDIYEDKVNGGRGKRESRQDTVINTWF
jgi:hypothetical protein